MVGNHQLARRHRGRVQLIDVEAAALVLGDLQLSRSPHSVRQKTCLAAWSSLCLHSLHLMNDSFIAGR
jgi:hypothetical protein